MRLWTFQPVSIIDDLKNNGVYRCNGELSPFLKEDWGFKEAYAWLNSKMNEKLENSNSVSYPIWAWKKNCSSLESGRPDLRKHHWYDRNYVLLELDIPDDRVLLSNFDDWHSVLNNLYYDADEQFWEDLSDDEWEIIFSKKPPYDQHAVRRSWDGIFNENSCCVQATFWEIYPNDVKKVYAINRKVKNEAKE